jgi:uncharacterized protein YkwD
MPAKRLLVPLLALLASLAIAPGAGAVGLQGQRIVAPAPHAGASEAGSGSLIAPESACPNQRSLDSPEAVQEQAMRCMTDFARRQAGLNALSPTAALDQSALDKSRDILRCNSFSHFACGREFAYWIRETGYTSVPCWHVGENLAWGTDEYGSVRSIFRAWMASPEHRENILGQYSELGVNVQVGSLEGQDGTRVWTEHFGTQCG